MDLRQGEALAGYTIVRLLKQGGFGTVYEAEQRGRHGRVAVALKVLKHEMSSLSPVVATRFVNEAKVAASLETSYIARVFNWGTPEGEPPVGDYWIAMELLEGEDFADWVAHHGPLDLHEAVRVVNETCQVLAEAHAKGVIHRDIKPSNIFRATDVREAEGWMTKVLDFGIARTRSVAVGPTGALGTPGWIAPEQANSGEVIGSHTDIWALGLLAFYLMSGKSYWSAFQDDPAADVFQFYDELQRGVLPAASERAKALKARSLPIGFDAWFASCVNREQRFRSVELAALAFARLPTVEDIDPHDVSPVPRAPKRKVAPVPPAQAALGNQSDLHPPALGTPPGIVVPERLAPARRWLPISTAVLLVAVAAAWAVTMITSYESPRAPKPSPEAVVRSADLSAAAPPGPAPSPPLVSPIPLASSQLEQRPTAAGRTKPASPSMPPAKPPFVLPPSVTPPLPANSSPPPPLAPLSSGGTPAANVSTAPSVTEIPATKPRFSLSPKQPF